MGDFLLLLLLVSFLICLSDNYFKDYSCVMDKGYVFQCRITELPGIWMWNPEFPQTERIKKSLFSHPANFIKPAAQHDVVDDLLLQHSNNTQAAITTHNYFCNVL